MDDTDERFFMCYMEDCFSPPVTIVRAANEQDAAEWYIEETPGACLSAEDAEEREKEYGEDSGVVGYGPNGEPYDAELLRVRECFLYRVECD